MTELFNDRDTASLSGRLTLQVFRIIDGLKILIACYDSDNLITISGLQLVTFLLSGEPGNNKVTKVGVGDGSWPTHKSDVGLSNAYIKDIDYYTFDAENVINYKISMDTGDGNGLDISEFGLYSGDEQLFARRIQTPVIPKDSDIIIEGNWTVSIFQCKEFKFAFYPQIRHIITSEIDAPSMDFYHPATQADIVSDISSNIELPPEDLQIFSSDGYMGPLGAEALWATARNTPSTLMVDIVSTGYTSPTARKFNQNFYAYRSFLYFDLSTLPAGATVTSAIVTVRGYSAATSQVCIQEGTQTGIDKSGLVIGDWNAFAGTPFDIVNWTTSNDPRNAFDLNTAGKAYIASMAEGVAKFCLREYDKDYLDVEPINNDKNGMYFSAAGEVNGPYITIAFE
jgi:hypothetical protein